MLRLAVFLVILLGPSLAAARSEGKVLAYPRESAWATAVRFVAVDERAKILDKDPDAGYVLFELRDDGKLFRGSLEVVVIKAEAGTSVRFVITLVDRPSWMEIGMLTRLEAKLRAELGAPNPPKPRPQPEPETPKKDADKDKDPSGDKKPSEPPTGKS